MCDLPDKLQQRDQSQRRRKPLQEFVFESNWGSPSRVVAALYAYESQIPDVSRVKREGLKIFYGINDERAVSFFTVHEEADLAHRETERRILANNATDAATRRLVLDAAQGSAKALLTFLDGVYEAFV